LSLVKLYGNSRSAEEVARECMLYLFEHKDGQWCMKTRITTWVT
jgi:hypothetical protein